MTTIYCLFCGANVSSAAGRKGTHIHCQLGRACTVQAGTIFSRRVFVRAISGDNRLKNATVVHYGELMTPFPRCSVVSIILTVSHRLIAGSDCQSSASFFFSISSHFRQSPLLALFVLFVSLVCAELPVAVGLVHMDT